MKKYVVTGGAGFIGSALVRGLLALGDGSVEVIDNLSTGSRDNLSEVVPHIVFHQVDIRDYDAIEPAVPSLQCAIYYTIVLCGGTP